VLDPKGVPLPVTVKDNEDGTYDVHYDPTDHGNHVVNVKLRGKPVAKSPYTVAVKEGASPENTFIESFTFVIQSRTKAGENKPVGGEKFDVSIHDATNGAPVDTVNVQDLGNGVYITSYHLPGAGEYIISTKINNKDICGSPFKQVVP